MEDEALDWQEGAGWEENWGTPAWRWVPTAALFFHPCSQTAMILCQPSPPLGKIILRRRGSWDWDMEAESDSAVAGIAGWGIYNILSRRASEEFWENLLSLAAESTPEKAESRRLLTHNVFQCAFQWLLIPAALWVSFTIPTLQKLCRNRRPDSASPLVAQCLTLPNASCATVPVALFCPPVLCHQLRGVWPGRELRSATDSLLVFCSVCLKTFRLFP